MSINLGLSQEGFAKAKYLLGVDVNQAQIVD